MPPKLCLIKKLKQNQKKIHTQDSNIVTVTRKYDNWLNLLNIPNETIMPPNQSKPQGLIVFIELYIPGNQQKQNNI